MDLGTIYSAGPFRRASLKGYLAQMSKPQTKPLIDDNVANILKEQGFSWQDEPRSIYDPNQLWERLADYGRSNKVNWDDSLRYGFRVARKIFACQGSQLQPLENLSDLTRALKLSKSSGLPFMTKKGKVLAYALDRESQVRQGLKAPNPCVAYKRTQAGGKTRLVWGYPLEMTIMEARFARPLIDQFLNGTRTTMAFGLQKYELGSIIAYQIEGRGKIYALDYSKFDSSIHESLIREAFDILSTWFSEEDRQRYGWNQIVKYFIATPIVMPDGNLYLGKRRGVPSGSYFTQLIDSIVNSALLFALSRHFQVKLYWKSLLVLGDDSLFVINRAIPLSWIRRKLEDYGIVLNVEKSKVDVCHFLGAYWKRGVPDQDLQTLINKAVQPESFRVYSREHSRFFQALAVLRSYSSCYLSAWYLVPRLNMARMWRDDIGGLPFREGTFGLSGSDKFHIEYEVPLAKSGWSPVSLRLLK